jgi:hypothetical protein
MDTDKQYYEQIEHCKDIFLQKTKDYGTAWRVLRPISIVDQIFIKAQRIKNLQEKKVQLVVDDIDGEFIGIINYGVIGLMQLENDTATVEELPVSLVEERYDAKVKYAFETMQNKNHDYGEAWRTMSEESFVDLILMKLLRVKQILQNDGKTLISEGIDANYVDIINYSVFALINKSSNK